MDQSAVRILLIVMVAAFALAAMTYQGSGNWALGEFSVDRSDSIPIAGVESIEASSSSTRIQVRQGDGDSITAHLAGTGRALMGSAPDLRVRQSGSRVQIEVVQPSGVQWFFMGSFQLEVSVPATFQGNLQVTNSSGRIDIEGLQGLSRTQLTSSSGRITGRNLTADQWIVTSSSGGIDLESVQGVRAQLTASSGSITLMEPHISDHLELKTSSGRIQLTMPSASPFSVTARSSSGRISNDASGIQVLSTNNNLFEGHRSSGGPVVRLETSSGGIQVR